MARILAEKTESSLRQVIHFAGIRPVGEAQRRGQEWSHGDPPVDILAEDDVDLEGCLEC
jgi:hypothetical protein